MRISFSKKMLCNSVVSRTAIEAKTDPKYQNLTLKQRHKKNRSTNQIAGNSLFSSEITLNKFLLRANLTYFFHVVFAAHTLNLISACLGKVMDNRLVSMVRCSL